MQLNFTIPKNKPYRILVTNKRGKNEYQMLYMAMLENEHLKNCTQIRIKIIIYLNFQNILQFAIDILWFSLDIYIGSSNFLLPLAYTLGKLKFPKEKYFI